MFIIDSFKKWWGNIFGQELNFNSQIKKLLWGILFFVIIALILTLDLIPHQIDLEAGQVSKSDISAPRTITFIDQEETQELQKKAGKSASKVYEEDNNVNTSIKENIYSFFTTIKNEKKQGNKTYNQIMAMLKNKYRFDITKQTVKTLINAEEKILNKLEKVTPNLMDKQLDQHILPGDLTKVRENLVENAMALDLSKEYRLAIADILKNMVKPNMSLNEEATQRRREEAKEKVEPVKREVRQGEIIIRKGDVVTEDDIKVLEALGLQKPRINYFNIIGVLLILLLLIVIVAYYLSRYEKEIWNNNKKLLLLELLVIIVVLLAKIISIFPGSYLIYLVPVAMASILVTVLLGTEIALILTIFLSFMVALVFDNQFNVGITSFVGGLVGIFSVSRVSQRSDMIRAGFNVSGVLVILILGLTLTETVESWIKVFRALGMGVLNGIFVAVLANGLLPYLENGFELTSSVKLLELSNPSQPLLKRLLVEAPGTYHHSVIVGNLAETAADNIGADSLLARVGAYYHDIGKLRRPYFFTDNQFGADNPHDKISANLSSLIIKSHVKDGVDMARKYRLPPDVIEIIEQHHGKNLISYFYQQALEDSKHNNIAESEFRYDGPKPQSKVAAIIMLADIVEAAVRSKPFDKNDHNRIEGLVRDLIRDKLTENQLDESDLTLSDLDTIASSFVKVLTGIFHQRVEYPENLIEEMESADKSDKD